MSFWRRALLRTMQVFLEGRLRRVEPAIRRDGGVLATDSHAGLRLAGFMGGLTVGFFSARSCMAVWASMLPALLKVTGKRITGQDAITLLAVLESWKSADIRTTIL